MKKKSFSHSHTVKGENSATLLYLHKNMSYEGVKKEGEPAGWYIISPFLKKMS